MYYSEMYKRTTRAYKAVYSNIVENNKRMMLSRIRV